MRERPLVIVLDEPTAALDAETEHALFERYAAVARDGEQITILVSHRFSTCGWRIGLWCSMGRGWQSGDA
jgi:ATP-binding cassette subfamily B protein